MAEIIALPTPNPQAYKFTIEGHTFSQPVTLSSAAGAAGTPFEALFQVRGVAGVFATANFVTLTKRPDATWDEILEPAKQALAKHFQS